MTPSGDNSRGIGCGGVLAVLVLFAVFAAWHLGFIDQMRYQSELEQAGENVTASSAAPIEATSSQDRIALPYAYSTLSGDDQKKYRIVLSAIEAREPQPYPVADLDDLTRVYQCVKADHPELFSDNGMNLETITNGGSGIVERVTVSAEFTRSPEDEAALRLQIAGAAERCLAGVPDEADDYTTAKLLYEWLANNVRYDHEAAASNGADDAAHAYAQTVEGVFVEGRAVCAGYAHALAWLLQARDIQCVVVTGSVSDGDHAWCVAQLDGDYYCIDPTWGDLQIGGEDSGFVNYDYLNVTDDLLSRTHVAASPFALPSCTATADNYYVREELLFDSPDWPRFGNLVAQALVEGRPAQIRCTDDGTYQQLRALTEAGSLSAFLTNATFRYSASDENLSITIFPA